MPKLNALEFFPPDTIRSGGCERRVGGVVYRLLCTLFTAPGRTRAVDALENAVWGGPVPRNTLWSACRRARATLARLGHPLRVALDGDRVTLV